MKYLQHEFFSRRCDGDSVWKHLITHGWNRGMMSSFFRLKGLLALLMVRHTKRDIVELPVPQYHSRSMPMGTEEVRTYNTLVCAIQSNLLITSMKGRTSGLQDSLLHRSQGKHARKALQNVRLVCAGGTRVIPTITNLYWAEFLRDFEQCSADPKLIKKMERYLSRATTEQVSPCDCCGTLLTTLLVVPCGGRFRCWRQS
jgi:SNF2-related domain